MTPGAGLAIRYRLDAVPKGKVTLAAEGGSTPLDLTSSFTLGAGKGWHSMQVPLACLGAEQIAGITLSSSAAFEFQLESMALVPQTTGQECRGPF